MASTITTSTTIRLDNDVHRHYLNLAKKEGRSLACVVRERLSIGHDLIESNKRIDSEEIRQMAENGNSPTDLEVERLKAELQKANDSISNLKSSFQDDLKNLVAQQVEAQKSNDNEDRKELKTLLDSKNILIKKYKSQIEKLKSQSDLDIVFSIGDQVTHKREKTDFIVKKIIISNLGVKYQIESLLNGSIRTLSTKSLTKSK